MYLLINYHQKETNSDSSVDADDGEEFEDVPKTINVEDDIFRDSIGPKKIKHLMPGNVEDEVMGTLHLEEQFEKRYGPVHPGFFVGSFEDAVKESCLKHAKQRKLLAVYLHHDNSVLANVFCKELLVLKLYYSYCQLILLYGAGFNKDLSYAIFIGMLLSSMALIHPSRITSCFGKLYRSPQHI